MAAPRIAVRVHTKVHINNVQLHINYTSDVIKHILACCLDATKACTAPVVNDPPQSSELYIICSQLQWLKLTKCYLFSSTEMSL